MGQALLQELAAEHRVELVALSIGTNDFKHGPTTEACAKPYLVPSIFGTYCRDNETVSGYVSDSAADKVRSDTTAAIINIAAAMGTRGIQTLGG